MKSQQKYVSPLIISNLQQEQINQMYKRIKDYLNHSVENEDQKELVTQNSFKQLLALVLNNLKDNEFLQNYEHSLNQAHQNILNDVLNMYREFNKNKEELTKFCIRTAFKYFEEKIMKENKIKLQKDAYKECMLMYFGDGEIQLPYKKQKGNHKTMNRQFLNILFQSQKFVADFKEFLQNFESFVMKLNQRKMDLLLSQLKFPLYKINLQQAKRFKRLPWPIDSIKQAYLIGQGLLQFSTMLPKNATQNSSSQCLTQDI